MIAQVIIDSNVKTLNKTFDYRVPTEMENEAKVGARVFVPFGNLKTLKEGYIIGFKKESEYKVKDIAKFDKGDIPENRVELAVLMARRYFCNISDCMKLMLPPGAIGNRVKEKIGEFVYLKKDIEEIEDDIEEKVIKSPKQIRCLQMLYENEGIHVLDLEALTDTNRAVINTLVKKDYIEIAQQRIERNPFEFKEVPRDKKKKLTDEQQLAYDTISKSIDENRFEQFLLYGVTGSGKTEIYLQLIEKVIKQGKRAMMLVPEISLTPQMIDRFLARFGDCISVLHSKLSNGERFDQWEKINEGKAKIVIGARSAVFAPVDNLGIVILDEEHDSSYKSTDINPRYNAKDIAFYLAKQNKIPFVLGSATPDVNTFYKAKQGKITLLTLKHRANNASLPKVHVVDLRNELISGNKSMISDLLHTKIEENLKNKKQTILFLNRRGYSTFVMCRNCGFTAKCKNCNITLTYHRDENKLKCHYCGFETHNITECPACKSKNVRYFGSGTQKLEEEIHKMFPEASTIRMDIDTVTRKNSHEKILNDFKEKNIDILIGTQMVVKGHHFPKVTLVGVIAADSSLNIEDYRASERTFQILTQVAGRAGREELPGEVVIQTYNPDHFSIEYSKEQNYDLFYNAEISLRQRLKYPPFCDIILLGLSGKNENSVKIAAEKLGFLLNKHNSSSYYVSRPIPSPINKIKNRYRFRIILKCNFSSSIINKMNEVLEEYYKGSPNGVSIYVDVNPSNMM